MNTEELETARYWTIVEGESPIVRVFARIPQGWENKLEEHPEDEEVFYWCDDYEWNTLGVGEQYGGVEILACYCCESDFSLEKESANG